MLAKTTRRVPRAIRPITRRMAGEAHGYQVSAPSFPRPYRRERRAAMDNLRQIRLCLPHNPVPDSSYPIHSAGKKLHRKTDRKRRRKRRPKHPQSYTVIRPRVGRLCWLLQVKKQRWTIQDFCRLRFEDSLPPRILPWGKVLALGPRVQGES